MTKYSFIIILLLLASCGNPARKESQPPPSTSGSEITLSQAQLANARISTGKAEYRTMASTLQANGRIDVPPQNMISVSVPLGGYLRSTQLLPGMHVQKGMTIAVLEDPQYIQLQQDYLTTKAKLETAEAEYNRQHELSAGQATSEKLLQQARSEFAALRIARSALAEKLRLINIDPARLSEQSISRSIRLYAPADGYVSKVNVNIGKYVTPSDILFEVVNPNDIHLNLHLFERDLPALSIGQKLEAFTNAHPEKRYRCEIILISKDIAEDRTAEVHCHFEQYDKSLLPGMYMNAVIQLQQRDVRCVPESAIVTFEGKDYVFTNKRGNTFSMVPVIKGQSEGGWTEIKSGLTNDTDQLVIAGAYTLLMSLKNAGGEE